MPKDEREELKPCPWCGSEAYIYEHVPSHTWQVGCSNDKCHAQRWPRSKRMAIKYWNTRVNPTVSNNGDSDG